MSEKMNLSDVKNYEINDDCIFYNVYYNGLYEYVDYHDCVKEEALKDICLREEMI
jgi:hypothetical protein